MGEFEAGRRPARVKLVELLLQVLKPLFNDQKQLGWMLLKKLFKPLGLLQLE